jgi:hypothetical protein
VIVRCRHAHSVHLLAHELEHVRQYREQGFAGFLAHYLGDYLGLRLRGWGHQSAYRRLPAEISAEWRARRQLGIGAGNPQISGSSVVFHGHPPVE